MDVGKNMLHHTVSLQQHGSCWYYSKNLSCCFVVIDWKWHVMLSGVDIEQSWVMMLICCLMCFSRRRRRAVLLRLKTAMIQKFSSWSLWLRSRRKDCSSRICFLSTSLCCSLITARCTLVQSAVLRSHVVCLSVCLSVRLSVMLVNCDHIGWNSSKIISRSVSLGCSLFATQTSRVYSKGNTLEFSPE